MDKPGRNDPCYCGSGKKYKQCHLPIDLAAEQEARQWADASRQLRAGLLEYADNEQFDEAVADALPRFWDGYYTAENDHLMDAYEADRFYDWFLFDYAPDEGNWSPLIARYAAEQTDGITDAQKALLDQWQDAPPMSGYILNDYDGQTLHLSDFLTGESLDAFLPSGHGSAPVGSLIVGRLVPVQDHVEFFTAPAYIPPDEIGDLKETLTAAMADVAAGDPSVSAADQLRRINTLIMVQGLQQAKLAGRPPVTRLDPNQPTDAQVTHGRHERMRVQGPSGRGEARPQKTETRRKVV
ncbi:MAG: SEC-C domain-containing protein [Chloroflexota bacterium]